MAENMENCIEHAELEKTYRTEKNILNRKKYAKLARTYQTEKKHAELERMGPTKRT